MKGSNNMELAIINQNNSELSLKEFSNGNVAETIQDIVGGNLKYIPLKSIENKLPKELKYTNMVVNSKGELNNKCKPNLLIKDEFIMGNIVFVNLETIRRKKVMTGLNTAQVVYINELINKYKICDIIKEILE